MTTTTVRLGGVQFADFEVPEKISFGGEHALTVHQLVGGRRVIDAMGRSDAPLEWTGEFLGPQALSRARLIDRMRIAGAPLELAWSELRYRVIIQRFSADFEKAFQLPYSISCEVIEDLGAPQLAGAPSGVDSMLKGDLSVAKGLVAKIGDGPLSGLMGTLDGAVGQVSRFATATRATINGVLGPLSDVQNRVGDLISSVTGTLGEVTTVGGLLPGNPAASLVSRLATQVSGMTRLPNLLDLQSVAGRMATNLDSARDAGHVVTMAGADLYRLAADQYGDAQGWSTIAAANGLVDPIVDGVRDLRVPPVNFDTGGVLQP